MVVRVTGREVIMAKKSCRHLKFGGFCPATRQFQAKREQRKKSNSASSQSGSVIFIALRWIPLLKSLWDWVLENQDFFT